MGNILNKAQLLWQDKGFEIMVGLCITFIITYGIYCKISGKQGTWSDKYHSPFDTVQPYKDNKEYKPNNNNFNSGAKVSKGEQECRRVLEELFGKPFPNIRPDFLRNPVTGGGHNLELDCYNSDMKLAVEYNGVQHYKYVPYFHRNKDVFTNQKYRDVLKERMCKDNRVNLISVPYTVKVKDIRNFLLTELRKLGYQV